MLRNCTLLMRVPFRASALILGVTLATTLSACTPASPVHLSERGRNIEACNLMAELYQKLYDDADSGNMGDDPDAYAEEFFASWERIGAEADSPMGDWMIENAEAAKAAQASGDTAEVEEQGEAANNGESVEVEEGSLQERCENLGVTLP